MIRDFGPDSKNPRARRAFAHTKISAYKRGEATYTETFEAVHAASHTRKGKESRLGRAIGGVLVDSAYIDHSSEKAIVHGLSPSLQEKVVGLQASGKWFGYTLDVSMQASDFQRRPEMGTIIADPIEDGFMPVEGE